MHTQQSTSDFTPPPPFDGEAVEQLGERIALLSAQISAATYQLLLLIREFDEREGWGAQRCRSCAHWLNWRTGLNLGAAREKVRVARALAELPLISEAMASGELSYSKVRALTRVATPEGEAELLLMARSGTASQLERTVRAYRRWCRDDERERDEERQARRYVNAYTDSDGTVVVQARLEPEAGAVFLKALEAAEELLFEREKECEGEATEGEAGARDGVTMFQRRADALGRMAEAALAGGLDSCKGGTRGDRYQVVVHVDSEVLSDPEAPGRSEIEDGGDVSAETSRRIACEASRVAMKHASDGRILDVGRKTRAISPALRRALTYRDKGCRFPGCGLKFCDAHHVEHWANGGETKLDNLVLLCRKHHRALHEGGFRGKLGAGGEFRVFDADGDEIPTAPAMPAIGDDGTDALFRVLEEAGIDPEEMRFYPGWDGLPLDLGRAVEWVISARNPEG